MAVGWLLLVLASLVTFALLHGLSGVHIWEAFRFRPHLTAARSAKFLVGLIVARDCGADLQAVLCLLLFGSWLIVYGVCVCVSQS